MLAVDCPPKVNLYLRIVRRREDGYHELETVFQSISGGDRLTAKPAAALSLTCSDPEIPTDARNLVLKAAAELRQRFPEAASRGGALELEKQTPAGAGLGGGSSDAAAALVLLSRAWGLSPTPAELGAMAARVGSDVPFFLLGGTALGRGRGEALLPHPTPGLWLVLVMPPVTVSTGWAYRQWRPREEGGVALEEFAAALERGNPEEIAILLRNDLEPGVTAEVPEIDRARSWLLQAGALGARMTGSGSAVFGVARDEAHAREIAAFGGELPGLVWAARALPAAEACPHVRRT